MLFSVVPFGAKSCEKRGKIVSGVDKNLLKIAKKTKNGAKKGDS